MTKIHLYNGVDVSAHDKEIYGDRIIVHREINARGGTLLEIRDQFGKVVKSGPSAKPELEHILSKFQSTCRNESKFHLCQKSLVCNQPKFLEENLYEMLVNPSDSLLLMDNYLERSVERCFHGN